MAKLLAIFSITFLSISAPIVQGQFASTTVNIKPGSQPAVSGKLVFEQSGNKVTIKGEIKGLSKGNHGLHIHKDGDLSKECTGAGPHFNPYEKTHGDIHDSTRHAGDLGNVYADQSGTAKIDILDDQISLDPKSKGYIGGRAIVIHEQEDDLGKGGNEESLKTGNAGARAGCGYISAAHQPSSIAPIYLIIGCIISATITKRIF